MNPGHFSYLLEGSRSQQTKVAGDRLELLAKTAAKRYLQEGASLNDSIKKIAAENDLNSNQIERVCEMANIATHQGLWTKTAQKEKISFPLADAKIVIAGACPELATDSPDDCDCDDCPICGSSPCSCDGAMDSDYAGPPKGLPIAGPSLASLMGVDPEAGHNGLTDEPEGKRIIIVLQKKAAERQRMADRLLVQGAELETLEKKAYQTVKQAVLGGASFRDIFEAHVRYRTRQARDRVPAKVPGASDRRDAR
jgi:hypothetical protein